MLTKNNYTLEELETLELMSITEAQIYIEFKIGMKRSTFYRSIRPLLNPKARAINFAAQTYGWRTVTKKEVDEILNKIIQR